MKTTSTGTSGAPAGGRRRGVAKEGLEHIFLCQICVHCFCADQLEYVGYFYHSAALLRKRSYRTFMMLAQKEQNSVQLAKANKYQKSEVREVGSGDVPATFREASVT